MLAPVCETECTFVILLQTSSAGNAVEVLDSFTRSHFTWMQSMTGRGLRDNANRLVTGALKYVFLFHHSWRIWWGCSRGERLSDERWSACRRWKSDSRLCKCSLQLSHFNYLFSCIFEGDLWHGAIMLIRLTPPVPGITINSSTIACQESFVAKKLDCQPFDIKILKEAFASLVGGW